MGGMIAIVLVWVFWVTFTALVMVVDRNLRKSEDFTPSPAGYFVLAAISPFLVLPIYFFTARRNSWPGDRAVAVLAGVGLTLVCHVLALVHATAAAMWLVLA